MGRILSTVFGVITLAGLFTENCWAEGTFSAGVSGGDGLHPFLESTLKDKLTFDAWMLSFAFDGRTEFTQGLGDADVSVAGHGDRILIPDLKVTLDASYEFDRERASSIKQTHKLTGDIGFEKSFERLTVNADAGAVARLHENTTQRGFPSLDRSHEDLLDLEAALRTTFLPDAIVQPFVEGAIVKRTYLIDARRDYWGTDIIAGFTFDSSEVDGDLGVAWKGRTRDGGESAFVFGPNIDLKWKPDDVSKIGLALGAGIDQDSAGPKDLFRYGSARLEVSRSASDDLLLTAGSDFLLEDRVTGYEIEVTPALRVDWSFAKGVTIFASTGLTYSKAKGEASTFDPQFETGAKVTW